MAEMTEQEKLGTAKYVIELIDEAHRTGLSKIWVGDWMDRARMILKERTLALHKSIARLGH